MGTYFAGVPLARVERTVGVVSWHVPSAPQHIIDVLTEGRRLGTVLADANTEFVNPNEVLWMDRNEGVSAGDTTSWGQRMPCQCEG